MGRIGRLLWVLNLAACGIALRKGRRLAFSYLHEILTLALWPETMVRLHGAARLPAVTLEEAFPGIDLWSVELIHPSICQGSVDLEEMVIINAIVRHVAPRQLVEIGTAEGRTTLNLASSAPPEARILTLDLPPDASTAAADSGPDHHELGIIQGRLLDHPLGRKVDAVHADSTTFDWTPYENAVDFIFIDGAHDYDSVRKDTENALRVIRPGGVILWHDYNKFVVPGVTRWLNELREQQPVVWFKDTTLACLRVGERR